MPKQRGIEGGPAAVTSSSRLEKSEKNNRILMRDFPTLGLEALVSGTERVDDQEYEIERRFKSRQKLGEKELRRLSKGNHIRIQQAYIDVYSANGEKFEIRLRRTYERDGAVLRRIAYKQEVKEGDIKRVGRMERQIQINQNSPQRVIEFERLFAFHKWDVLEKTRYYIFPEDSSGKQIVLPSGSIPEIHYDVHTEPGDKKSKGYELEDFRRIEIEIHGDPGQKDALEADWKFLAKKKNRKKIELPQFIGKDVTDSPEFKSKPLAEFGSPKRARTELEKRKKAKGKA